MRGGRGRGGGRSAPYDSSRRDRASRSASQGAVEEAATEEEAQPPAEAAAAPGKLPPLGKEDLKRLVERFGALGFHLPKNIDKLRTPESATTSTCMPGGSRIEKLHMHEARSSRASS